MEDLDKMINKVSKTFKDKCKQLKKRNNRKLRIKDKKRVVDKTTDDC